jgi:hypothetical protein
VLDSERIEVLHNRFYEAQGPLPRGQFVQFNKVFGSGNRIAFNHGENTLGISQAEDAINIFESSGVPSSPILIEGNVIVGGGPSLSGGGILLGDYGGHDIEARRNTLIDPGQYGIGVAGGTDITVEHNKVIAKQQSFTNVGIYVWAQKGQDCAHISIRNNYVRWVNNHGKSNPWWDANDCGKIDGLQDNDFGKETIKLRGK